jgi:predicted phage terminase large subunit-like protein
LAGWILENSDEDWKILDLPAINANGDALWPEAYSVEKLKKIRATVGDRVWESLYQQRPSAEQGAILKRDWWQKLNYEPRYDFIIQSYDTAFSTKESADFSARTTWGVFSRLNEDSGTVEACVGLIEAWRDRVEYPDLRRIAQDSYWEYKPNLVLIEKRASGQSLLQDLRRAGIPVHEYKPDKDKVSRTHAIAPMLQSGLVWVPSDELWVEDIIGECASFPYGKHDDYVDTCTQAWQLIRDQFLVAHPLDPKYLDEWDDKPIKSKVSEKRFYS